MFSVCLVVLLFLASALSEEIQFSMQFQGNLQYGVSGSTFALHAKAPSQSDTTSISPQDGIKYDVKTLFGSYALLDITSGTQGTFAGNVSLGTHLSRDHSVQIAGSVFLDLSNPVYPFFSAMSRATSGTGQFRGIRGAASTVGSCYTPQISGTGNCTMHFTFYGSTSH
eukprot:TRINITY_DN2850_c0_g1_i1.p1 TRINITY_DN2850_c0_g1~~TRINITY_DN2850_c0_g1_i1.p1  ORF type:complete len:187 (-),score=13.82 TRINITY_DN2850_c0_g1_i1:117-620(-)